MRSNLSISYFIIYALLLLQECHCWDNEELEIFDLVEEINENFYSMLGIPQDANATAVRKAFRGLSLVLHPDKNPAPDAEQKFRNLVAVYDVIKDPGKRKRYDEVLENGLPNWRSAVYYYRHVRKMGLAEMSVILFILISIGQYAVGWAAYVEHKLTAEAQKKVKLRKLQKKSNKQGKINVEIPELEDEIPKPSVADTLPIQIPKLLWVLITSLPLIISSLRNYIIDARQRRLESYERNDEAPEIEENVQRNPEQKSVRRRKPQFVLSERPDLEEEMCILDAVDEPPVPVAKPTVISGGFWSDDDLAELVRLVNKYPPGTAERWERIATSMCRPVPEITHMAAKLKTNSYRLPEDNTQTVFNEESTKKVKTKSNKLEDEEMLATASWSQPQQKAFENALIKFPKGSVSDRWEKIAKSVPNKTKEECMVRYKYLVGLINKQRSKPTQNQTTETLN